MNGINEKSEINEIGRDLAAFIEATPTSWHAAATVVARLEAAGFRQWDRREAFDGVRRDAFYVQAGGAVVALRRGETGVLRLIATHGDAPTFRLKPRQNGERRSGFGQLAVEPYGGMIVSSWMDRPLGVAGRVFLRGEDPHQPTVRPVASKSPLAIMPNLCIHLGRNLDADPSRRLTRDAVPLYSLGADEGSLLERLWAEHHIDGNAVLAYDLQLVPHEPPVFLDGEAPLLSAPRLDNAGMVHAALRAFLEEPAGERTQVFVMFDHEEVGSGSHQAVLSPLLREVLAEAAGENFHRDVAASSFALSADQAHGAHPNYAAEMDMTHAPLLNGGPVIKGSAQLSYAGDGETTAILKALGEAAGVPLQDYRNRSDVRGGSTLGPLLSRQLAIPVADVGNPILAMHSVRELGGVRDQAAMIRLMRTHYRY